MQTKEKRRCQRIYFSSQERPQAIFRYSHGFDLNVKIMDLGKIGMGLCLDRQNKIKINTGDQILLVETLILDLGDGIKTEIVWVQDNEHFNNILFGCEFINLPSNIGVQIEQLIGSWFM